MASLQDTPRADRVHIAFLGKTNAGKSSAINAITGGNTALVSPVAGTTTDPVYKSMELLPVGPVVLIDTGGLDDDSELGKERVKKTEEVVGKTDVAVMVARADGGDLSLEKAYEEKFRRRGVPVVWAFNLFEKKEAAAVGVIGAPEGAVVFNAKTGEGIDRLKQAVISAAGVEEERNLLERLAKPGDLVLLVMPQDIQAPKGRLILPQVQVTRALLDMGCKVVSVKTEDLPPMLDELKRLPDLVITDSQVFQYVNGHLPGEARLTSFSMVMARSKGDIDELIRGARAIAGLKPGDKVLIAESCTHHAQKGDIAREKLPRWLEEYAGGKLEFANSSGPGFPEDIADFKLIVHCGACMVNRRGMMSKMEKAREAGVPITNFGVAIAFLNGMLGRVES